VPTGCTEAQFAREFLEKGAEMNNRRLWVWFLAALVLPALTVALAQDQDSDPPSRVARIAYLSGDVSFEPASLDGWADASLNYPMGTGDNLYANSNARAVLRIGQNSIRLNSGTNFQFVNLNDNVVQTSINAGSLSLRVRHLDDGESWEVDTPNGAVTVLRTGEYRVDTDTSRNATLITVRAGDVEVTANNQSFPVHSGQTAYIDNSGNPPDVQQANQPDDFDTFAYARDRMEDVPPPSYVSPDMVGYEDLNENGDWRDTPEYGPVWTPRVEAGWTPYHEGRWAWVEPWGWTWVDDEPWGFAPFHYGRWAYVGDRWGWCPGPVAPRVYYAPALVAFVGGGGFAVGRGGLVGWFPLGPREPYYPSYHVSPAYIRQVNVTNTRITNIEVTNIHVTNINYVNRNAMVAMPQNSFASAQSVQRAGVRVNPDQMRQAQVIGAAPQVVPQRESVLAASSAHQAMAPPAAIASRPVVAKLPPPPPAVSFAAKQQLLQQHPGTPVAPAQLQALRSQTSWQNQAPGRAQVQAINPQQVHSMTPTVHAGPAPGFAQRPLQPRVPAYQQPPPPRQPGNPPSPGFYKQPQAPGNQPPPGTYRQPQTPANQPPPPGASQQPRPPVNPPPGNYGQPQGPSSPPSPGTYQQPRTPVNPPPPGYYGQPKGPVNPPPPRSYEQPRQPVNPPPPPVHQQPPPPQPQVAPGHGTPPPPARTQPPPPKKEDKKDKKEQ
jgi:hypothetical protein